MCIRDSFNHLRDGKEYDRLYEAALSRSKADWIVGINGTRLFTTLYHKKLVVGRVQTPTLAMLVERDGKISTFQKEKYFNEMCIRDRIMVDRKRLKNPNGLILGTTGSGKSFYAKREMTNAFLITEDDIIV